LQYCGIDRLRYDWDCRASFASGVCIPNIGDQAAFCAAGCSQEQISAAQAACRDQCAQTPGCTRSRGVKFCSVGGDASGGASRILAPCAFE
jgi:hypothetical protein